MDSLVEVIFRGLFPSVNLNFLKELVMRARELYFVEPEDSRADAFDKIIEIINSSTYIDFVINTNEWSIHEKKVSRVFIISFKNIK